jgi:hypothetical protein
MKTSLLLICLVILSVLCLNSLYVSGQEEDNEYNVFNPIGNAGKTVRDAASNFVDRHRETINSVVKANGKPALIHRESELDESELDESELDQAEVEEEELEYIGGLVRGAKAIGRGARAVANNPTVRSVASKGASLVNIGTAAGEIHDAATKESELDQAQVEDEQIEYAGVGGLVKGAKAVGRGVKAIANNPTVRKWAGHADKGATAVNIGSAAAEVTKGDSKESELDQAQAEDEQLEYAGVGGLVKGAKAVGRGVKAIANNPTVRRWAGHADKGATAVNIGSAAAEVTKGDSKEAEFDSVSEPEPIHPRRSFHHRRNQARVSVNVNVNTQ